MLTLEQAKDKGFKTCISKIGAEFVRSHADRTSSAFGEHDGMVFCFIGVSDRPMPSFKEGTLRLSPGEKPKYRASCDVKLETGEIVFLECVVPEMDRIITR